MTLRALYYASPILPVIIDSVVYATILIFLVSIIPMPESLLKTKEENIMRIRRIIAACLGIILALVLQFSFGLNLEILLSGGLAWGLVLLLGLIILIPAIGFLFKKKKNGDKKKFKWIKWIIIIILAVFVIAMFVRTMPVGKTLVKSTKEVFDYALILVLVVLFVFLLVWLRRDELKKKKEEKKPPKSPKEPPEPEKEDDEKKEPPEPEDDDEEEDKKEPSEEEKLAMIKKINDDVVEIIGKNLFFLQTARNVQEFKAMIMQLEEGLKKIERSIMAKISQYKYLNPLEESINQIDKMIKKLNAVARGKIEDSKLDRVKNAVFQNLNKNVKEIKNLF